MLIEDALTGRDSISSGSSSDLGYLQLCLEVFFSKNNMYNAYLQELITYSPASYSPTCQRQGQRIKELKERAMSVLSPYCLVGLHELSHDSNQTAQASESGPLPFVSLLEFVSGIYRKEPEQLSGNDVLWTFLNFAGGDDTNFQTLVALLNMLSTLTSSQEGAATVLELLLGAVFHSVGGAPCLIACHI